MKLVKSFTVKRSQWQRGNMPGVTVLDRESDHKKCCVGFFAYACKVPKKRILNNGILHEPSLINIPDVIYNANDLGNISEAEREKRLKEEFKKLGITIKFVD